MSDFTNIVDLISEFLGDPKRIYEAHAQISWNCPICDEDRNKGNLEVNLEKMVFHCWSCGEVNDMHGTLNKLFNKFANKKQKKLLTLLLPDEVIQKKEVKVDKLKLPENFVQFKDSSEVYPVRRQAYNYLKSRGVADDIIDRYRIGFCDKGSCSGRIIVPSFDLNGELNYYIARSWNPKSKSKYKNPVAEKDKIIFNEYLVDWNKDIYLVEGVFDAFFLDNSIPMLGKHLSEKLFISLYEKARGNIIISLDGDAWNNAIKLYNELNGGELYGRIKILKLPEDKDVCDLKGQINDYFYEIK